MQEPTSYYGPHLAKQDYDRAFNEARLWALGEGSTESALTAARIYHVKEEALCKSVSQSKSRQRNSEGLYSHHGSNNKILNEAQEEAVRQYCYEQWEMGLGATHQMVFAAICFLRQVLSGLNYINIILIFIISILEPGGGLIIIIIISISKTSNKRLVYWLVPG
jgi:hypothetical protein